MSYKYDFREIDAYHGFIDEFKEIVKKVIREEGGHHHNPNDPGGETKFGISKNSYEDLIIGSLTELDAAKIYYRDYWTKCRCSELGFMGGIVFDMAVNAGTYRAQKMFQAVVGSKQDGIIGPKTIAKAESLMDPGHLTNDYTVERLFHYNRIMHDDHDLREFAWIWIDRMCNWVEKKTV